MATLFGVTTDHLLSEADPVEEKAYTYSSFDTAPTAPPAPKANPHRHDWVIGVVIACIGAGLILFSSVALIIISFLTGSVFHRETNAFEQEVEIYPDGSVPLPWEEEMDGFFGDSDALKEWLESQEDLMTDTSSVETQTEATETEED